MKKAIFLSIFFLIMSFLFAFFHSTALADDVLYGWVKGIGGTGFDTSSSMAVDGDGNAYITGMFEGTVDFDPGDGISNLVSAGGTDVFIIKLNSSGDFVWAKRFGAANDDGSVAIILDNVGNIYTNGYFRNTVDFDPGAGTSNLVSAGSADVFIIKLDSSGDFVWAKRLGGTGADICRSMVLDSEENIYTTGIFSATADFDPGAGTSNLVSAGVDDIFVSKLDSSGDFVWAKRFGGTGTEDSFSVALDSEENVYTTGYFSATADFDPGAGTSNLVSAGGTDIFISKLDASGNFVWIKSMGGIGADEGYSLALDSEGNLYTAGLFEETVDFDPGVGTSNLTSAGSTDLYISKLDSSGDFVWVKQLGGSDLDLILSLRLDEETNIYTVGYFSSTVDFDPGSGTSNLVPNGSGDGFISKLDSSGEFVFAKAVGGSGDDQENFITLDSEENIYTTGFFSDTVDFDPGSGTSNLVSSGNTDIFILKLSQIYDPTCFDGIQNQDETGIDNGGVCDPEEEAPQEIRRARNDRGQSITSSNIQLVSNLTEEARQQLILNLRSLITTHLRVLIQLLNQEIDKLKQNNA